MKKPKSKALFEKLTKILASHPVLSFSSESDFKMEVVRLTADQIRDWPREKPGTADIAMLQAGTAQDWEAGWKELAVLFIEPTREVAIRRPTNQDSVFAVYLLCRFGTVYVGIKTYVVET